MAIVSVSSVSAQNAAAPSPTPANSRDKSELPYLQDRVLLKLKTGAFEIKDRNFSLSSSVTSDAQIAFTKLFPPSEIKEIKAPFASGSFSNFSKMLPKDSSRGVPFDWNSVISIQFNNQVDVGSLVTQALALSFVEFAQPSYRYSVPPRPDNVATKKQGGDALVADVWGLEAIRAKEAWKTTKGQGITVAVVDTGVNRTHPDLTQKLWRNSGEALGKCADRDGNGFIDDLNGWSFADEEADSSYFARRWESCPGKLSVFNETMDFFSHGSHVSGIIAGATTGVAPLARIMPVKGLGDDGSGNSTGLAKGILYATVNGARVISNSWGEQRSDRVKRASDFILNEAARYAASRNVVVVFAAGNDGQNVDGFPNVNYIPDVISVTAVGRPSSKLVTKLPNRITPQGLLPAFFTSYGTAADIAAPGIDIYSTTTHVCDPNDYLADDVAPCPVQLDRSYGTESGTSMATPYVSGVAALILSVNPSLSPNQVRSILRVSAQRSDREGIDTLYGAGLVDAAAAVQSAFSPPPEIAITSPSPFENISLSAPGNTIDIKGSVLGKGFSEYRVYLSKYDDAFTLNRNFASEEIGRFKKGGEILNISFASIPKQRLSTGRYLVTIKLTDTRGRISYESISFGVIGNEVTKILRIGSPDKSYWCFSANDTWAIWEESEADPYNYYNYDHATTDIVSYNFATKTRRVVYSFQGGIPEGSDGGIREYSSSCPTLLPQNEAVWFISSSVAGGHDNSLPISQATIFRGNLLKGTSESVRVDPMIQGLPFHFTTNARVSVDDASVTFLVENNTYGANQDVTFTNAIYTLDPHSLTPRLVKNFDRGGLFNLIVALPRNRGTAVIGSEVRADRSKNEFGSYFDRYIHQIAPEGGVLTPRWSATPRFMSDGVVKGVVKWGPAINGNALTITPILDPGESQVGDIPENDSTFVGYLSPVTLSLVNMTTGSAIDIAKLQSQPPFHGLSPLSVWWDDPKTERTVGLPLFNRYSVFDGKSGVLRPGFMEVPVQCVNDRGIFSLESTLTDVTLIQIGVPTSYPSTSPTPEMPKSN